MDDEFSGGLVRQFHRCESPDGAQNVVLIRLPAGHCAAMSREGRARTGKTHVATAQGVRAVEHHRRKVRFLSTVDLVNTLERERRRA